MILAITHIKNLRSTSMLQGLSPYKSFHNNPLKLTNLRVLEFTVYVFIHEEEQKLKSQKFVPRTLKSNLGGFDGHTIYHVYIKEQKRVIRVKDLQIFENTKTKKTLSYPTTKAAKKPSKAFFLMTTMTTKPLPLMKIPLLP